MQIHIFAPSGTLDYPPQLKPAAPITVERLRNLHLDGTAAPTIEDAVRSLVAMQAQDFSGTKWALGLRTATRDAEVEAAFAAGRILRTHLLRPTWHFVLPEDIRWLTTLSAPKVLRASAPLFRRLELDPETLGRSVRVFRKVLKGGVQLSREDLRTRLEQSGVETRGNLRYSYLLMHAELQCVITSGARQGKQFTYALLDERAPHARVLSTDDAIAELTRRYFMSRGPATVHDLAKWSWLTIAQCRLGIEASHAQLEERTIDGVTYWSAPASAAPGQPGSNLSKPTAHLLSIYDEYISSYKNHHAVLSSQLGARLRAMGNALTGILLLNGTVAGTWKRAEKKNGVVVTVELLRKITKAERSEVEHIAQAHAQFFSLELQLNVVTA